MRPAPLLLAAALTAWATPVRADDVGPSHDFFDVLPGSQHVFQGPYAVPADFFAPGSDPFTGRVDLRSAPMSPQPSCADIPPNTGVLVRRPTSASLPTVPSQDMIPIEIVQLSLQSVSPITVTYNGGQNPELWDVRLMLSTVPPPGPGGATVRHTTTQGGTFSAQFPVAPRFEFVKVQPQPDPPRPLDLGQQSFFDVYVVLDLPWSHTGPGTLAPTTCAGNFRPTVQDGTTLVTGTMAGPQTTLVVQWPLGGPTEVRAATWGMLKVLYR